MSAECFLSCCGMCCLFLFLVFNALIISFMTYGGLDGLDLTVIQSVKMDWNQPLIKSVYTVRKDQSCRNQGDNTLHYPWFGAKPVGRSKKSGKSTTTTWYPGFPMLHLNVFGDSKYCLESYQILKDCY